MKIQKTIAAYHRMRTQPLWRLLASDKGPITIGLLQAHLYEKERCLPSAILHERMSKSLEMLRAGGEDLPQTAEAYIANWLADGYLERRFPSGATEEEYELSTAAVDAIRFVSSLVQPYSAATESRLTLVIEALVHLAEDTDIDKSRRINRLKADQARIKKEILALQSGQINVLSKERATERAREIIVLADELAGDFRRVRDQFELLNRELRQRILDNEGSRGEVLDNLFAGIDLITQSDAGRTFSAFWRLLTNPEQSATFDQAIEEVLSREFVSELSSHERRFLMRLTGVLLEQGGIVHEVLQTFARSLKHFVQSREYLEQRRLNQLLKEAERAANVIKESVKTTDALSYELILSSCQFRSISQWCPYNPDLQAEPEPMRNGENSDIDLATISQLVAQSEIDFRSLKKQIQSILALQQQVSIAQVLEQFPAEQGLGSIVGLLALGSRHGRKTTLREQVVWTSEDGKTNTAYVSQFYFLKECLDELR